MNLNNLIILEKAPTPQEYLLLRKKILWEEYIEDDVETALVNSLYSVSVYEKNQMIGFGRVVGDGRLCFYIQDIMVDPEVQGQGVGSKIMNHIIAYIHNNAANGAYIGLMSKKGKESFYERYGFVRRPNKTMGHGMVIPNFTLN